MSKRRMARSATGVKAAVALALGRILLKIHRPYLIANNPKSVRHFQSPSPIHEARMTTDLRHAIREFRKRPALTLTAVLSLALGIGATTAVFSVIYAVLINPYPYRDANRIVQINLVDMDHAGLERWTGYTGADADQFRQLKSFESVVPIAGWNLTTTDSDLPEDVRSLSVYPGFPDHWGVPAMMGRWLIPSDAPAGSDPQPVVVLSYKFWQRYYLGDPHVIGRTIRLVHQPYEIVGVMPPRFQWGAVDLYRPAKVTQDPSLKYFISLKLRKDVPIDQANAELQPLVEQIAKQRPAYFPASFRVKLLRITDLYARDIGSTLYVLLAAVASLLLIGCGNVSILLLARGIERQHEFAVRAAVGADRSRILRQLLTESFAIAAAGSALGLLIAWHSVALIVSFIPVDSLPPESIIKVNIPVALFSVVLAFVSTIIAGLWPALQFSRPNIAQLLQSGMRRIAGNTRARRSHNIMIGVQVALTVALLALGATAAKGFLRLMDAKLGYDPQNCLVFFVPVHDNSHVSLQDRVEFYEQIRAGIASLPQFAGATISGNGTPPSSGNDTRIEFLGRSDLGQPELRMNFIGPEFFSLLHIPLLQGRVWDHAELMRSGSFAVVNESMAHKYWPNGDAIGHQLRTPDLIDQAPYSPSAPGATGWLQIIGVVADSLNDGMRSPIQPAIYVPYSLHVWMGTQILAKTRVPPLSTVKDAKAQVAKIDPDQQVTEPSDLYSVIKRDSEYAQQRLVATLFGVFSILALTLAVVGLYSVVSYSVATRTNEFGIRMALGARAADVFRLVLSSTTSSVGSGLLLGLIISLAFSKLASHWVNEPSRDPIILTLVTATLIASALAASLIPARRASTTDPMTALRHD
jgi:putative ABC transport system permease protein